MQAILSSKYILMKSLAILFAIFFVVRILFSLEEILAISISQANSLFDNQSSFIKTRKISPKIKNTSIQINSNTVKNITLNEYNNNEYFPTRIIISEIKLDLPIVESKQIDGKWTISDTYGNFSIYSSVPSRIGGNTVIFAHNRPGSFSLISHLRKNSIIVIMSKHYKMTYSVESVKTVLPTDISVLKQTDQPKLTLITCSGIFSEKRLIVVSRLIKDDVIK